MTKKTQIRNLMRRLEARSQSPVKKAPRDCRGGPLAGHTLYLDYGRHTLPFTLRGQSGRYVNGYWEPSR